jgi:hypothetical protein
MLVGALAGLLALSAIVAIGVPESLYLDAAVVTLPGWFGWIWYWRRRRRLAEPAAIGRGH